MPISRWVFSPQCRANGVRGGLIRNLLRRNAKTHHWFFLALDGGLERLYRKTYQKLWADGGVEGSRYGTVCRSGLKGFHWPGKKLRRQSRGIAIWLILPVVIRLSQRLSHACLSINESILWNCVRLIKPVIVYLIFPYYSDTRSNSRANTCVKRHLSCHY